MRWFATLAATLLLGAFATTANAHIEFAQVRLLSLDTLADRWVLDLEIHRWESGGAAEDPPRRAKVQIQRVPRCIVSKHLLGTREEFDRALGLLRQQIADGGVYRIGLNAVPVTPKMDVYLAVNLRIFAPGTDKQLVFTVRPETGLDLCPFKYVANR